MRARGARCAYRLDGNLQGALGAIGVGRGSHSGRGNGSTQG
jgi:hypothetical protein